MTLITSLLRQIRNNPRLNMVFQAPTRGLEGEILRSRQLRSGRYAAARCLYE